MNRVYLSGRLTKDPEFTTTTSGISLCRFSIAVSRKTRKEDGTADVDFINCVAWRTSADFISKYAHKGNKVGVSGSIQTRTYDATDGSKRHITEVLADEVELYSLKSENENKPKTEAFEKQEIMKKFEPIETTDLPF